MDPPVLGTHCTLPSCKKIDFLPICCPHCSQPYCQEHALPVSLHSCPADPSTTIINGNRFSEKFNDLLPDPNRRVTDREDAAKEKDRKRDAARAVLEKNFGKEKVATMGASGAGTGAAGKIKPRSAIVELMKLKERAVQGDPRKKAGDVPMEQRIYWTTILFDYEGGERAEKGTRDVWMLKTTSVGKALDLLADHFKLENVNNLAPDPSKVRCLPILIAARPRSESLTFDLQVRSSG
ncbi:hypothetical protein P7C70_g2083, partial [Phenoliferia sp. Uapishka_3]